MPEHFSSPSRSHTGSEHSSSSRSPRERKLSLRQVLSKVTLQKLTERTISKFERLIVEADEIATEVPDDDKAMCQDEVLMDSQVMTASSMILKKAGSSLSRSAGPYTFQEFAESLLRYVHQLPNETVLTTNWNLLSSEISTNFKRTPNFTLLAGALKSLPTKKPLTQKPEGEQGAKRNMVKRETQQPTKRPDVIRTIEKSTDSIEETVQKVKKLVKRHCRDTREPLNFFRLIIDPHDFSKTVENMLHVSFLIRDDVLSLSVDKGGNLLIKPTTHEQEAQSKKTGLKGQNVIDLNMQQWKTLIEKLQIKEPMINFA